MSPEGKKKYQDLANQVKEAHFKGKILFSLNLLGKHVVGTYSNFFDRDEFLGYKLSMRRTVLAGEEFSEG